MSSLGLWALESLLDVSIKATLLVLVAWAGMALFHVRSTSARHFTWLLVLLGMILLPPLMDLAPAISAPGWLYPKLQLAGQDGDAASISAKPAAASMPSEMGQSEPPAALPPAELASTPTMGAAGLQKTVEPDRMAAVLLPAQPAQVMLEPQANAPRSEISTVEVKDVIAPFLIVVYFAGVVLMFGRLLIGMTQMSRLVRRARPVVLPMADIWLPEWARLAESDEVRVPVTLGHWQPVVVVPADWKSWSDSFTKTVLAHEAAHIRRCDTWIMPLAACNCAIYWFHPVSWIVRRRLIDLAEQICDDEVIRATGNRTDYARNLVEIAGRLSPGRWRLQLGGVAMARKPYIEKRIEAILDADRPLASRISAGGALLLVSVFAPFILLAAGLQPAAHTIAAEAKDVTTVDERNSTDNAGKTKSSRPNLKGRVVMATDGKPVPNAVVRLLTWDLHAYRYKATTARTNEKGEFSFDALTEGKYRLAANYEDYSSRTKRYQGKEVKADDASIVLVLHKAPSLKVKVVSRAEHKPIEGATVRLTWTDTERDHRTDASGEVVLRGLTPEVWTTEILAKGYAEQDHAVNLAGTDVASVTAELDPGVELFGTVRDDAGKGLADVGISVFRAEYEGGQIEYHKTDAEGHYRFEFLPIAGLKLHLSKDGYADLRPDVTIAVRPGEQQELNLTLPRRPDGGSVAGVVVDSKGAPILGARVSNNGRSSREVRSADTDAEGRFLLEDVYEGSSGHELIVKAKRFAPRRLSFSPGTKKQPAEVSIALDDGHSIRGKVVDEQGAPIADVRVYFAHGNSGSGMEFGGRTTTDEKGRFEFDSLPPKTPFEFVKDGYSEIVAAKLSLDGAAEVVVAMLSEGVIRGHVVDDKTGKPVSPFMVQITFSPDRTPDEPSASLSGARAITGEQFATPDGTFKLSDLVRDMPLQVTVAADGYERKVFRRVVAAAEPKAESVEFRLTAIDPSSLNKVAGRLVDEQSRPVVGAELRLIVASKRPFPRDRFPFNWEMIRSGQVDSTDRVVQFLATSTDREGRFAFDGVRHADDIELVYWGEGVAQDRTAKLEQLSAEKLSDLTIHIKTPAMVRGAIDRKAFPNVSEIMLSGGMEFHRAEIPEGKDSYEIRNVPAGQYELQIYGASRRTDLSAESFTRDVIKRIPLEVKSGETLTRDIGVEPREASLSVKGSDSPSPKKEPALPADGRPAGAPGNDEHAAAKDKAPAREASTRDDPSEVVIAGKVTDASGDGIKEAKLWLPLKYDDQRLVEATTNDQGQYTLRVPAAWTQPGPFTPAWTIWCYAPDHQIASASAYKQLRRQSDDPIEITLKSAADTGFVVTDASGQPVGEAIVEPWHFLGAAYEIVPEGLRKIISRETDKVGRVLLPAMGRDGFHTVQVTAKGYGVQQQRLKDSADEPAIRAIALRAAGRIEGRLVSDDKSLIRTARVFVYQEDFMGQHTSGQASANVEADGQFVVPEFAEGPIKLVISVDQDIPLRPRIPENLEIYAGQTTKVDVPFEETVRVQGRVQTKEGGKPVADALVSVQYGSFRQGDMVQTDADGRFATNVLAGELRQQLIMQPEKFSHSTQENAGWQSPIRVPAGAQTFDLPPIELIETIERTGRLVDRNNRPIAEARISAITGNRVFAGAQTDKNGAFALWLPEALLIEKYRVSRTRAAPPAYASVIKESPLVLQFAD